MGNVAPRISIMRDSASTVAAFPTTEDRTFSSHLLPGNWNSAQEHAGAGGGTRRFMKIEGSELRESNSGRNYSNSPRGPSDFSATIKFRKCAR